MEKDKLPRECELCSEIIYYVGIKRKSYTHIQDGVCQTGISKKYPDELAGYCKKHNPKN